MANGITTLSAIQKSLKLTLDKVWGDNIKGKLDWEQSGFETSNTKDAFIDDQEYAGTGPMPAKGEGANIAIDSIQEGYSKRYLMVTYAQRVIFSREARDDAKYKEVVDGTKYVANAAKLTQEYTAASVYNNAYTTGYIGGDGVVLGSASHPLPKGGTYSNIFSTFMSLTETAIETMSVNMAKLPDSNGYITNGYMLKKIVVPWDLKFRLKRILNSAQQNDTANNAINALKGDDIGQGVNRYFTSTTQWAGISNVDNGLRFVWRQKPEFEEDNVETNLTIAYQGYQRFAVGWTNPRGWYGSNT